MQLQPATATSGTTLRNNIVARLMWSCSKLNYVLDSVQNCASASVLVFLYGHCPVKGKLPNNIYMHKKVRKRTCNIRTPTIIFTHFEFCCWISITGRNFRVPWGHCIGGHSNWIPRQYTQKYQTWGQHQLQADLPLLPLVFRAIAPLQPIANVDMYRAGLRLFLRSKDCCASFLNLHSLPFLPSPLWSANF